MELTGGEILFECLIREGVDLIFGYPGGAILPAYDSMTKYPQIRHVLVRHEQGAAHAADGYARATGKVGVAMATSGPGATNLVTGIATAMLDSVPMVCITGQVGSSTIGSDAFQEVDVTGVTLPVTKHNYLVTEASEIAPTIREAFHIARSGRPGPVLVDITKDAQINAVEFVYPEEEPILPGYRPVENATDEQLEAALELIANAQRPVILAGHGILMGGAISELRAYAEKTQTPVALTILGKGGLPEAHPLCLGMMGMHGEAGANHAIQEADLLIALGMRFDDRVTGDLSTYAPNSRKIHVDIDRSELNKNVLVDIAIAGDVANVLNQILPLVNSQEHPEWLEQINLWRKDSYQRDILNTDKDDDLRAVHVIRDIWQATKGDALVVTDVGQHQMWEAQYYPHQRPNTLLTSGGLGTMGFALPAAIGAKMGMPHEVIWAIAGDGGFQMTSFELATAVQENVNINIAVINNSFLGMVRQWQEMFYEERYTATPMRNPNFCKLAEAYGVEAIQVTRRAEVIDSVHWAESVEGPALIEYVVKQHDTVYPMVPAGASLDNMIRRPYPEEVKVS